MVGDGGEVAAAAGASGYDGAVTGPLAGSPASIGASPPGGVAMGGGAVAPGCRPGPVNCCTNPGTCLAKSKPVWTVERPCWNDDRKFPRLRPPPCRPASVRAGAWREPAGGVPPGCVRAGCVRAGCVRAGWVRAGCGPAGDCVRAAGVVCGRVPGPAGRPAAAPLVPPAGRGLGDGRVTGGRRAALPPLVPPAGRAPLPARAPVVPAVSTQTSSNSKKLIVALSTRAVLALRRLCVCAGAYTRDSA